eukprot:Polyplicarium_translucidae@DN2861_c0_g1_i1.p1
MKLAGSIAVLFFVLPTGAMHLRKVEDAPLQPSSVGEDDRRMTLMGVLGGVYRLFFGPVNELDNIFYPLPPAPRVPELLTARGDNMFRGTTLAEELNYLYSNTTAPRAFPLNETFHKVELPKPKNMKEFATAFLGMPRGVDWTAMAVLLSPNNKTGKYVTSFGVTEFEFEEVVPGDPRFNTSHPMANATLRTASRGSLYKRKMWLNLGYLVLLACLWIIFGIQCSWGALTGRSGMRSSPGPVSSLYMGCLYRASAKSVLEVVPRFVTAAFLHGSLLHIFANSACILQASVFWMHGNTRYLSWFPWLLYPYWLVTAIVGNIASYATELASSQDIDSNKLKPVIVVGASGGAVGLQAAVMVLSLALEGIPTAERRMIMFFTLLLTAVLSAFPIGSHDGMMVAVSAHIGGLVSGLFCGVATLIFRRVMLVMRISAGLDNFGKVFLICCVVYTVFCWLGVAFQALFLGRSWASPSLAMWIGIRSRRDLGDMDRATSVAPIITGRDDRLHAKLRRKWMDHYQYDSEAPLLRRITLTFTERDFPGVYSKLEKAMQQGPLKERGPSWLAGQKAIKDFLQTAVQEDRKSQSANKGPATIVPFQRFTLDLPASAMEGGSLSDSPEDVNIQASPISVEIKSVYTSLLLSPFLSRARAGARHEDEGIRLRHSCSALNLPVGSPEPLAERQLSLP